MSKSLYAGYFTGAAGSGLGLFLIGDGIVAGADAGGMKYDGTLAANSDGSLEGVIRYTVRPDVTLVTGTQVTQPSEVMVPLKLPAGALQGKVVLIETPFGAVNVRFELVRENV